MSKADRDILHNDIIEGYYLPTLKEMRFVDYNDFVDSYSLFINLANHYREISRFDDAFTQIAFVAKKMQYWGKKDELLELINIYPDELLNENNQLLKTYLYLLIKILSFSYANNRELETNFKILEQTKEKDFFLYLESKNLEGIYWRILVKDINKAIDVHQSTVDLLSKKEKKSRFNIVYGKIFENLGFCYQQNNNIVKAEEAMTRAQKYLIDSKDTYELAKFYVYITSFKYNSNPDELSWVPYLNEASIILKKYRYPDIERNMYNLLARIEVEKFQNLINFFNLKTRAIDCDLVLYNNYFVSDFMSIYKVIAENKNKHKEQIVEGLQILVDFFQDTNLENEKVFIELVKAYLLE